MKIHQKARILEEKLRKLTGTAPRPEEPLEIYNEVLSRIVGQVRPVRAGKLSFPFDAVKVKLPATEAGEQQVLTQLFASLESDLHERLKKTGCETIEVETAIEFVPEGEHPFELVFETRRPSPGNAVLRVIKGAAEKAEYLLGRERLNIGRLPEVTDAAGLLVRRNHIFFLENDVLSETVSRVQAHIVYSAEKGVFGLVDDGSSSKTQIHRDGQMYSVSRMDPGTPLRHGDVICMGKARMEFLALLRNAE